MIMYDLSSANSARAKNKGPYKNTMEKMTPLDFSVSINFTIACISTLKTPPLQSEEIQVFSFFSL